MVEYNSATVNGITRQTVLNQSQIQKVLEKYNPDAYRFTDHLFSNSDRITIPVGNINITNNDDYCRNDDYRKVNTFLHSKEYEILDYAKGLCKPWYKNSPIKIGKILERLKAPEDVVIAFTNGPSRQAARKRAENLRITISRNPMDVASMSTNRGWTSCMNLNGGCHSSKVMMDIKHGTHIAYIHDKDDVDILKPMARVLLKAHRKKYSRINGLNKVLVPEPRIYGMSVENFVDNVTKWCEESFNPETDTIYTKSGQLYDDGSGEEFVKFDENSKYLHSENARERAFIAMRGTDAHRIQLVSDKDPMVLTSAINNLKNKKLITAFLKNDAMRKMITSYMHMLDVDIKEHREYIAECDFKDLNIYVVQVLMRNVFRSPEHLEFFKEKLFSEVEPRQLIDMVSREIIPNKENAFMNEIFERNKDKVGFIEYFISKKPYFYTLSEKNKKIILDQIRDNLRNSEGSKQYISYMAVITSAEWGDSNFTIDDIPDNVDGQKSINRLKDIARLVLEGKPIHSYEFFNNIKKKLDFFGEGYYSYMDGVVLNYLRSEINSILYNSMDVDKWIDWDVSEDYFEDYLSLHC